MAAVEFDEETARQVDRAYATPDVVAQRAEVLALLAPQPGERVLDVGSGPGYLVASLADAVGSGGAVHGLDPSGPMNDLAHARNAERPWVHIDSGDAAALPYPDATFDAGVSTQVYEYVPDIPGALAELHRVLRPGGRALILDTDWDSLVWHVADQDRHARILSAWEEHLIYPYLPRRLARLLGEAGFRVAEQRVLPLFNPALTPDSFSANLMQLVASFVVDRQGLTRADADAWLADLRARDEDGEYFFSLNRYLFLAVAA
ncbi:methyltransferase domain-containing protein [Pseudonocardia bannensis]|uniref:Methyltransferase domain-containing protein n=1 Tax=Pseudonocardia bannensis TaxID=630973 RepID=A0A848DMJ7_9PSEU|nr:methyltransferase domain-containing protein [Pseudonocardia bannensis]NMH94010.1 methyltransferase domain-containing protein [Pseudonocardia bannensis]